MPTTRRSPTNGTVFSTTSYWQFNIDSINSDAGDRFHVSPCIMSSVCALNGFIFIYCIKSLIRTAAYNFKSAWYTTLLLKKVYKLDKQD